VLEDEVFMDVVEEEEFSDDILQVLENLQDKRPTSFNVIVEVHSKATYNEI